METLEISRRLAAVRHPDRLARGVLAAYRAMVEGVDRGCSWLYHHGEG